MLCRYQNSGPLEKENNTVCASIVQGTTATTRTPPSTHPIICLASHGLALPRRRPKVDCFPCFFLPLDSRSNATKDQAVTVSLVCTRVESDSPNCRPLLSPVAYQPYQPRRLPSNISCLVHFATSTLRENQELRRPRCFARIQHHPQSSWRSRAVNSSPSWIPMSMPSRPSKVSLFPIHCTIHTARPFPSFPSDTNPAFPAEQQPNRPSTPAA